MAAETTNQRPVLARLRAVYGSLSESERRVADLVHADSDGVVHSPIKEVARRAGVSEATVVRFCRSVGYDGMRKFKVELAAEALTSVLVSYEPADEADDLPTVIGKVLRSDMQAIADTLAMLDAGRFGAALEAILGATRVEFYGVGSSVPIVLDGYYRFVRLGLPATVVTDPHMQATSAAHLPAGAVAFAISHTGRAPETHTALSWAKQSGATCVLLTSFRNTPIGELADIEIVAASPESALRPESVASRIAHLAIIDALSVAAALRRPAAARQALIMDDEIISQREVDS
jgi:RpiR family transcriptional regulator, carbohydrate utilization regulator